MRKEFEKLPEIAEIIKEGVFWDGEIYRRTAICKLTHLYYVRGAWYAWQAKAQAVQEGFVLVSKDKLHEWKCMARRSEELGCPDCYESRGYAHNLAEEIQSEEQNQ